MIRKAIVLILLGAFGLTGTAWAGTYSGGTGEPNNPYRIETPNDLNDIGNHVEDFNKCFVLVNDINLAGFTYTTALIAPDTNKSSDWFQGTAFTGVFDGNGHTISNFTYDCNGGDYAGLFGVAGTSAEIKDLTLIDPNVDAGTGQWVGSLVGWLSYGVAITRCGAEGGSVSGYGGVGGLVGFEFEGTILNCYATVSVAAIVHTGGLVGIGMAGTISNCYSCASVSGRDKIGGLVGEIASTVVSRCHAAGSVSGVSKTGGLAGVNNGTISMCHSNCNVEGELESGGLVGCNREISWTSNCYSQGNVDGNDFTGGLVGRNYHRETGAVVWNCYAIGAVNGSDHTGGLVGDGNANYVTTSFWNVETTGQATSDGGEGKPTAEMMTESTFTDAGWDFVEIWDIGEKQTYPFLRVYPAGDIDHDDRVNFFDFAIIASHWLEEK